jgi:chromosome segregation ATPase
LFQTLNSLLIFYYNIRNVETQIAEGEAEVVQLEQHLIQLEHRGREAETEVKQVQRQIKELDSREFQLKQHVTKNTEEEVDNKDYISTLVSF